MIVPKEIDYLLNKEKRKDAKQRILKVYEALLYKKGNKNGYFDCPSAYLEKINVRYYKVINSFLENGILEFYSKNEEENLFEENRKKKYYNTEEGHCIKYKFLIDLEEGYTLPTVLKTTGLYDNEKWFHKTKYSLLQLEFPLQDIKIARDNFSRRLHTNITGVIQDYKSYKNLLSGGEYYAIDSKTSQPRLLWLKMTEIGLQDDNLNYIFDNNLDFYEYIIERIPAIKDLPTKEERRIEAKELFASWINGTGYLEEEKVEIRNIFPVANGFIKNYKTASYKNVCRLMQYTEATIFIDDLLNNVPVDFCLTVHDSLIVKKKDAEFVLNWCKERRPELRFELEEIKNKK